MILRILVNTSNININKQIARVVRVYNRNIPAGITEAEFTQKGGWLVGSGSETFGELAPGSVGQYPTPDPAEPLGIKWVTPTFTIDDTTNHLLNGGFTHAQLQTPGTLTTITDNTYSADLWKTTRENADLQYVRQDGSAESGLTSLYYGQFKKITNAGKFLIFQPLEYINTLKFRGATVNFQLQMKASGAKTIKIAIVQLQTAGTADTLPTPVSAWGADSTDPTLGTNLATIGTPVSCSVTTAWQVFRFTGTFPTTAKNLLVAVWTDADFAANDTLSLAEAGLYYGEAQRTWTPRPIEQENLLIYRHCERMENVNAYSAFGTGFAVSTTKAQIFINFKVAKRAQPVITYSAGNTFLAGDGVSSIAGSSIATIAGEYMLGSIVSELTVAAGFTQYRPYIVVANNQATGAAYIIANSML